MRAPCSEHCAFSRGFLQSESIEPRGWNEDAAAFSVADPAGVMVPQEAGGGHGVEDGGPFELLGASGERDLRRAVTGMGKNAASLVPFPRMGVPPLGVACDASHGITSAF